MVQRSRVLFMGDSLIGFYEWQDYFSQFDCVNLGVPGETVAGWHQLTEQASVRYPDATAVVVMLGANNIWQQDYSFLPDYEILLNELRRLYPESQIIVCSLLPHELPWLGEMAIPRLNESLQRLVTEAGADFLDLCTPFKLDSRGCFMEDGVHLSQIGYKVWCEVLEPFLIEGGVKEV